ncbi:hypothetical protein [Shewanella subflava]|uniref:Uncharacterized protein n=1 Tax=Shewanella subflava TaxID=2986476 RepID=A0ABT3ICH7_9GAMM|nr:hypothetical protein [Shewanella subflava]MCW3173759.1 hypothetical protein [Shewanella subflava]
MPQNNFNVSTVEIIEDSPPLVFEPLNLTAPRGGFFVSEKDQATKSELDKALMLRNQYYFASLKPSPAGRPTAETVRLVKDCKSPTRTQQDIELSQKLNALGGLAARLDERGLDFDKATVRYLPSEYALHADTQGKVTSAWEVDAETGELIAFDTNKTAVANLSFRAWSDEYRIRVASDASPSKAPPQQSGDRVTKFLTTKAAKNILDSGAYVSAVRGGYTTFLTLTFSGKARRRIINGESTIGAECSRFFDAMQKMYQRGWIAEKVILPKSELKTDMFTGDFDCIANDEETIPPSGEPLDYLWVAEAPAKEKIIKSKTNQFGQTFDCIDARPNPHCHVLLRWQVEPHLFRAWAKRIESIWGQGFAKLERIKNADAASGYMLKALGYLLKGEESEQSSQGTIKGNRYNISKPARALPWEHIASFHAEHMASIIGEVKAKLERKAAPTVHAMKTEYKKLTNTIKQKAIFKNQGKQTATIDAKIKLIELKIRRFKAHLRKSPVRAFDYMVTFKGKYPLKKFMDFAIGARFWNCDDAASPKSPRRLPENLLTATVDGVKKSFSKVRNRILELESYWRAKLAEVLPPDVNQEANRAANLNDFMEYEKCLMTC